MIHFKCGTNALTVFPADGEAEHEFYDRVTSTSVLRSSFIFCFAAAENRVRFGDRQKFVHKIKYRGSTKDGIVVNSERLWRNKRWHRSEFRKMVAQQKMASR